MRQKRKAERDQVRQEREAKRVGYIVISTDRGLCGGLNVNLFKQVLKDSAQWQEQGAEVDFALIGSKAGAFFQSFGANIIAQKSTRLGGMELLADCRATRSCYAHL